MSMHVHLSKRTHNRANLSRICPFRSEVGWSTTVFPNSSNFSEVVRSPTYFKASMSNILANKNLCFKKTWRFVCFKPRSNEDESLWREQSFTELASPSPHQIYFQNFPVSSFRFTDMYSQKILLASSTRQVFPNLFCSEDPSESIKTCQTPRGWQNFHGHTQL